MYPEKLAAPSSTQNVLLLFIPVPNLDVPNLECPVPNLSCTDNFLEKCQKEEPQQENEIKSTKLLLGSRRINWVSILFSIFGARLFNLLNHLPTNMSIFYWDGRNVFNQFLTG